jgi:hypothetical protein
VVTLFVVHNCLDIVECYCCYYGLCLYLFAELTVYMSTLILFMLNLLTTHNLKSLAP